MLGAETAVPARRTGHYLAPREGEDVLVKLCEGIREIKVTKVEPKKANGTTSDDDEDSDVDSEEEDEEVREKLWRVGTVLAEVALRNVKHGAKIEVTANVATDLSIQFTAREVGRQGGVRGEVKGKPAENGTA